nr:ferrochelatase [Candidatus Krumholzibacteria bacterium]
MSRNGIRQYPKDMLNLSRPTGLILCGMGGPDRPEAVRPFLRNLFADPAIFPLPRLIAPFVGAMIARKRSAAVAERYLLMDPAGATPQLQFTRDQAALIAQRLTHRLSGAPVLSAAAMRYWHPYPEETVAQLLEQGAQQFVVGPTYPQFSPATGGSTLDFVMKALQAQAPEARVCTLPNWYSLDGYIENLSRPVIDQFLAWASEGARPETCALIYVAHSMPMSFIKKGDPYEKLTRATVALVHAKVKAALSAAGHGEWLAGLLSDPEYPVAYQSKVGPIKWLEPGVEPETMRLAQTGCRRLMVQPISFVCDHIETLVELDIELKEEAEAAGITHFSRGAALNLQTEWMDALAARIAVKAFGAEVRSHV